MKFDNIWIANRKLYRKGLNGNRMQIDPLTGYLEPIYKNGFSAKKKAVFIERLRICKNFSEIVKSIGFDQHTVYDAIALDSKFREAVNACSQIPDRKKHLNNALETIAFEEKCAVVSQLAKAAEKYKK